MKANGYIPKYNPKQQTEAQGLEIHNVMPRIQVLPLTLLLWLTQVMVTK